MAKKHMKKCSPSLAIKEMLARMWGKRSPHTLLVGM
jgi:hypothetical protein